jgi:hypothetical protein
VGRTFWHWVSNSLRNLGFSLSAKRLRKIGFRTSILGVIMSVFALMFFLFTNNKQSFWLFCVGDFLFAIGLVLVVFSADREFFNH